MFTQDNNQDLANRLDEMFESEDNNATNVKSKGCSDQSVTEDLIEQDQVSCSCCFIDKTNIAAKNPFLSGFVQRLEKRNTKHKNPPFKKAKTKEGKK